MPETRIYGQSDDLIEVEGAVREEFYANYNEDTLLVFSNGVVVGISYDGEWKITVEASPDGASVEVQPAPVDYEGVRDYTDMATVETEEPVRWIAKASRLHKFTGGDA